MTGSSARCARCSGYQRWPTTRGSRTNADRTRNREQLRPLLLEQLAKWSADDLFVSLNKEGVPCGPINTIGEGVELAESLGLAPRVEVGSGDRAVTVVRNPITFSDADVRYELPPPGLGEHSDEIRAWLARPLESDGGS